MYLPSYNLFFNPIRRAPLGNLLFDDAVLPNQGSDSRRWSVPPVDIKVHDDKWSILVDLPGIHIDDINVDVDGYQLTVEAHQHKEETEDDHLYTERYEGTYKRSFKLPESADTNHIVAEMSNGVLDITVAKKEVVDSKKKIQIEPK